MEIGRSFEFLRVAIEAQLRSGAVVAVTSAQATDGAPNVAVGVATAFAEAGKPTLLVSAQPISSARAEGRADLTCATLEHILAERRTTHGSLGSIFAKLREAYAVIIVAAEPMPLSTAACELVREADAVLVAIRLGRKPNQDDRTTMKLLDACGANVLGIVPTAGNAGASRRFGMPAAGSRPELDVRSMRAPRKAEVL